MKKILLMLIVLCFMLSGCSELEETKRTPIDTKFVAGHYEEEEKYTFRPPCFYTFYTERYYVDDAYYILYYIKYTKGETIKWVKVTKEQYEECFEQLEKKE